MPARGRPPHWVKIAEALVETAKEEDYTTTGMGILQWYDEDEAQPYKPKLVHLAKRIYRWLQKKDQDLAQSFLTAAMAFVAICWGPYGEQALQLRVHYRDVCGQIELRNNIYRKLCRDFTRDHPDIPPPAYLSIYEQPPTASVPARVERPTLNGGDPDALFPFLPLEYVGQFVLRGRFSLETSRRNAFTLAAGISEAAHAVACSAVYMITYPTDPGEVPLLIKIGKTNTNMKKITDDYQLLPAEPAPGALMQYGSRAGPAREAHLAMQLGDTQTEKDNWCGIYVYVLPAVTAPGMNPNHARLESGLLEQALVDEHYNERGYKPEWNVQERGKKTKDVGADMERRYASAVTSTRE
jgi:hypothetical protein